MTFTYWLPDEQGQKQEYTTSNNSVIIIGANGSGKSHLGAWIEQQDLENVHRIGAQRNLNFNEDIALKSYSQAENFVFYGTDNKGYVERKDKAYRWEWGKYTTKLVDDFENVLAALIALKNNENELFVRRCREAEKCNISKPGVPITVLDMSAVAYEDVPDKNGRFPLLRPMSELAGKGGFLAALHYMQAVNGGPGKLLANVAGVERPVITCLGCGNIGIGVAELACGMGNEVRILDVNMDVMLEAKKYLPDVSFMISNRANLEKCLKESDVIINGIQWAKDRKDHIIYREDLKLMKRGSIIVDVACDDNGAVETCRSTTHDDPVFYEEGILHYCVDNIPGTL